LLAVNLKPAFSVLKSARPRLPLPPPRSPVSRPRLHPHPEIRSWAHGITLASGLRKKDGLDVLPPSNLGNHFPHVHRLFVRGSRALSPDNRLSGQALVRRSGALLPVDRIFVWGQEPIHRIPVRNLHPALNRPLIWITQFQFVYLINLKT